MAYQKEFPLRLSEFTYVVNPNGGGMRRLMFVWVARDQDEADEAFEEAIGVSPEKVAGLEVEDRMLFACIPIGL